MNTREIKGKYLLKNFLLKYSIILTFLIIISLFSVLSPTFRSLDNLFLILFHTSVSAIIGFGLTLVMITGNYDLSCSSVLVLSSILSAILLQGGFSITIVIIFVFAIGALIGCINGLLISMVGINSVIVTLATMFILKGFSLFIVKGNISYIKNESFIFIGRGLVGNIPFPIIITIIIAVFLTVFTFHTKFGRHSYAIGKNIITAKYAGIKVKKIILINFILCGLIASLGGIIEGARAGFGYVTLGEGLLLQSFAVVFLGQGAFLVGEFQIPGTLIGALLITVLVNGMTMLQIEYFKQYIVEGIAILLVVSLTMYLKKMKMNTKKKKLDKLEEEESIGKK